MAYVPPEYPGEIPSAADLPDRTDDVDWMYAARYNELKKELRAVMIELGVDPAGAHATVVARLNALAGGFTDRGDPAANDFEVGNFTKDGSYYDLNLSAIVPAGAKAVLLGVRIRDDAVGSFLLFRKNGNIRAFVEDGLRTQIANLYLEGSIVVACDTNRVIEYRGSAVAFDRIYVNVKGWWE